MAKIASSNISSLKDGKTDGERSGYLSPRTQLLGSVNVPGCSTDKVKKREIDKMFVKRKFDVLALSGTN